MQEREYGHKIGSPWTKWGRRERKEMRIWFLALGWAFHAPSTHLGPWLALVAHNPPLSSPRSRIYDLVCPFWEHFSPVLSPKKSYGLIVRFARHFSELILPLDLAETLALSIYLFSMVLSLSRMISSREIKSCLSVMMLSKLIFDNKGYKEKTHNPYKYLMIVLKNIQVSFKNLQNIPKCTLSYAYYG